MSNKNFQVKNGLTVGGSSIDAATGNTLLTGDLRVNGDLRVDGNDIKSSTGAVAITLSGADTTLAGDLQVSGNDIKNSSGTTILTFSGSNLNVSGTINTASNEFVLNYDQTGTPSANTQVRVERGSLTDAVLVWDETADRWAYGIEGTTTYMPNQALDTTSSASFAGLTINSAYTMPTVDGAAGYVISTDGAGNLTWSDNASNPFDQDLNTTDDVQFASVRTSTINANGGVSFVNTGPMGGTYANVNAFGPATGADLTTVDWVNSAISSSSPVLSVNTQTGAVVLDTDDISEGSTNLYFTTARARQSISATGDIAYDNTTGVISYSAPGAPVVSVNGQTGAVVLDTDDVSEGSTNLYYTDARARAALSAGTGISYDNSTGVITSTITQYTDADARASISATGDISYNSSTGVISYTAPAASVTSVNGQTGAVVLDTDDISEGSTNLYYTNARARAALSAGTGLSYNSSTGEFASTITQYTDADARAAVSNGTDLYNGGAGNVYVKTIRDNTFILGNAIATPNSAYTPLPQSLNTVSSGTGMAAASGIDPSGAYNNGYNAGMTFTQYYADTRAGSSTAAALTFQGANGNSVPSTIIPWTGVAGVAPSAQSNGGIMGTLNFSPYATTNFASYIAAQNQGGGYNATHACQAQAYLTETAADGTLTISGATITAVSRINAAFTSPSVTGTKGQISFSATTPAVGHAVAVTGTLTGTATGIVSGNTYYIIATNGSTTAQLSATPGGDPITTTAGTLTGLTLTRQAITVTYSAQAYIPFGLQAKVTISGFTNVTSGTYMCGGTSTATSVVIGAPSTGVPALSGSQSISTPTVTNTGSGFRIRAFPTAIPMNTGNRVDVIDLTPASSYIRTNTLYLRSGSYGNTGTAIAGSQIDYNRVVGSFYNTSTITPAAANTAYALPIGTSDTGVTNLVSVASTSRITPLGGKYNIQFSIQWLNSVNSEYSFWIWLRKDGVDVANSASKVTCAKSAAGIAAWNWLVNNTGSSYWEIMYAVESTDITFPAIAAAGVVPGIPSLITTVTPVGA